MLNQRDKDELEREIGKIDLKTTGFKNIHTGAAGVIEQYPITAFIDGIEYFNLVLLRYDVLSHTPEERSYFEAIHIRSLLKTHEKIEVGRCMCGHIIDKDARRKRILEEKEKELQRLEILEDLRGS